MPPTQGAHHPIAVTRIGENLLVAAESQGEETASAAARFVAVRGLAGETTVLVNRDVAAHIASSLTTSAPELVSGFRAHLTTEHQQRRVLRVVADGWALGSSSESSPAETLSRLLGVAVAAPTGPVRSTSDGRYICTSPHDRWITFENGTPMASDGSRAPAPDWQEDLPTEFPLSQDVVVDTLPGGLWLRPKGVEPSSDADSRAWQIPASDDDIFLVLGLPDVSEPSVADVVAVLDAMPEAVRSLAVLVPLHRDDTKPTPLAQRVATATRREVLAAHVTPTNGPDGELEYVFPDFSGRRPFVALSQYRYGRPPLPWLWRPLLSDADFTADGILGLKGGWVLELSSSGMILRSGDIEPPTMLRLRPLRPDVIEVVLAAPGADPKAAGNDVVGEVAELCSRLSPPERQALVVVVGGDEAAALGEALAEKLDCILTRVDVSVAGSAADGRPVVRDTELPVRFLSDGKVLPRATPEEVTDDTRPVDTGVPSAHADPAGTSKTTPSRSRHRPRHAARAVPVGGSTDTVRSGTSLPPERVPGPEKEAATSHSTPSYISKMAERMASPEMLDSSRAAALVDGLGSGFEAALTEATDLVRARPWLRAGPADVSVVVDLAALIFFVANVEASAAPPGGHGAAAALAIHMTAGLRRLPSCTGPVQCRIMPGVQLRDAFATGEEIHHVPPLFALEGITDPGADLWLWSSTARRLQDLGSRRPLVGFLPGTVFRVLAHEEQPGLSTGSRVRSARHRVLLAETPPEWVGSENERRESRILTKLKRASGDANNLAVNTSGSDARHPDGESAGNAPVWDWQ